MISAFVCSVWSCIGTCPESEMISSRACGMRAASTWPVRCGTIRSLSPQRMSVGSVTVAMALLKFSPTSSSAAIFSGPPCSICSRPSAELATSMGEMGSRSTCSSILPDKRSAKSPRLLHAAGAFQQGAGLEFGDHLRMQNARGIDQHQPLESHRALRGKAQSDGAAHRVAHDVIVLVREITIRQKMRQARITGG